MMKNTVIFAAALLLSLGGCTTGDRLRSGDLVFVGIPMEYSLDTDSMDGAIAAATGSGRLNLIHVAIAEVRGDSTWIIDATIKHGVDRHPLDTFLADFTLRDGSYPTFKVMRLKDDANAALYVENAKKFIGQAYDPAFLPDNGAMYCSELVRDSYRDEDGNTVFSEAPMNFKDENGEFPVYWEQLFARLGMAIPQGITGTNPQKMSEEAALTEVGVSLVQ